MYVLATEIVPGFMIGHEKKHLQACCKGSQIAWPLCEGWYGGKKV